MKKKSDPRHQSRIKAMKALYEYSFRPTYKLPKTSTAGKILTKLRAIDKLIAQKAPAFPIGQISPTDLSILRLAIWELIYKKEKEPYKVIVDEAVEIAKEFGTDSSPSFVNGVLGAIIKSELRLSAQNSKLRTRH